MARSEQKVCRSTCEPMIRSPARLQPKRSTASIADWVKGLPSAWQNTSSDFRCQCALSVPYNVSKAAVKVYTEALQHELRSQGSAVSAHLLVPGWTTGGDAKPQPGA